MSNGIRDNIGLFLIYAIIMAVLFAIGIIVCGCADSDEYRTSDCEWHGEYVEDLILEMCCIDGVDFENNWIFHCPECIGASYTRFKDSGCLIRGFLFVGKEVIEKIEPGEEVEINIFAVEYKTDVYCSICEYPLGYDWKLIDFSGKTKNKDIFSRLPLNGSICGVQE